MNPALKEASLGIFIILLCVLMEIWPSPYVLFKTRDSLVEWQCCLNAFVLVGMQGVPATSSCRPGAAFGTPCRSWRLAEVV